MTCIYSSDVTTSDMPIKLIDVYENSKKLESKIEEFIQSSKDVLVGQGYNNIRGRLLKFCSALKMQANLCEELSKGILTTNGMMEAYMEDYSYLDDSLIPEVRSSIAEAKSHLDWLESYTTYEKFNENTGLMEEYRKRNGTDAQIASYQEIILELEKKLAKLEGLVPADNNAFRNVEDLDSKIDSYILLLSQMNLLFDTEDKIKLLSLKYRQSVGGLTELINNIYYQLGEIKYLHDISYDDVKKLISDFVFMSGSPSYVTCGDQVFFYSQHGYYDENGNLIPWPTNSYVDSKGNLINVDISENGCSIASVASIISSFLGREVTPSEMADIVLQFEQRSYGSDKGGKVANAISQSEQGFNFGYTLGSYGDLDNCLENGGAAEVAVGGGDHWVAVLGKVEIDGTTYYIVNDPYSNNPSQDCLWTQADFTGYNFGERETGHSGNPTMVYFFSPEGTTIDEHGNITHADTYSI